MLKCKTISEKHLFKQTHPYPQKSPPPLHCSTPLFHAMQHRQRLIAPDTNNDSQNHPDTIANTTTTPYLGSVKHCKTNVTSRNKAALASVFKPSQSNISPALKLSNINTGSSSCLIITFPFPVTFLIFGFSPPSLFVVFLQISRLITFSPPPKCPYC